MKRLITKQQFADMAKVSHVRIVGLCKTHLAEAVINNKIDMDHPAAKAYLAKRIPPEPPQFLRDMFSGADQGYPTDTPAQPPPVAVQEVLPSILTDHGLPPTDYLEGTDIEGLGDMTLRELASKYGTVAQLTDWLNARKRIVDIAEKEIKLAKMRGELVPREFVSTHVIQQFERTNMNLLNDAPKTIASELISLIKAGCTLEQAEESIEKTLGGHIKAGIEYVKRVMLSE